MDERIRGNLEALITLCERHRVRRLALFGSGAGEGSHPRDLDLLVEFEDLRPAEHADAYFGLLADLEDLLEVPVDLIEDRAIRNPYFRAAVDEQRVLLYEAA